jgi:preprotein translocase subunit SecG
MYTFLMLIYVVICFALIITVLLQSSKGEGLAGAFGGGGGVSGAVFGGRGAASFLSRATTVLAILFMMMAVVLSFMGPTPSGVGGGPSAVQQSGAQPAQSAPATEVPGTQEASPASQDLFGQPADTADK